MNVGNFISDKNILNYKLEELPGNLQIIHRAPTLMVLCIFQIGQELLTGIALGHH